MREEGLDDLSRTEAMYRESDGEVSLIRQPGTGDDPRRIAPALGH